MTGRTNLIGADGGPWDILYLIFEINLEIMFAPRFNGVAEKKVTSISLPSPSFSLKTLLKVAYFDNINILKKLLLFKNNTIIIKLGVIG